MTKRRNSRPKNTISKNAASGLTEPRRADINEVVNRATDRELDNVNHPVAIAHNMNKTQNYLGRIDKFASSQAVTPSSVSQVDRMAPDIYSPLFQLANLNLPRDRVTMNAWNRIFYDTHPIVRNAVNLHASFPISKINISCKDKKVQQFFSEMSERIDLYSAVYGVSLEFWKHGEAFPYTELDHDTGTWKRISIQNPDFVHVKKAAVGDQTFISLRPDAATQRMITSNAAADMKIRRSIPKHIVELIRKGQNIPLDAMNISHLKLLSSPYDIRGTSIIVSIYKDLMLYDRLRESKFAQADGMVNPITLVKLGGDGDYRPTASDIESFKQVLEEAQYDKDFKIVTHNGVTIERVGFSGATLDISTDIELIINNIYAGLMTPKSLMDNESSTYASSSVGLEVLRQRYDIFRNMIKKWIERKIFAPICEIQDFFEYKDGEKRLIVPTVDFNHMNLYDMMDYIQQISQFVADKSVSTQTLYRSLGLSWEEEQKRLREEAIAEAIRNKEQEHLAAMPLAELLTLNPDQPVPEPKGGLQPGGAVMDESGIEGLPGVGGPELGGMPGGGGGGLIDIPDMGGGGGEPPMPGGGTILDEGGGEI